MKILIFGASTRAAAYSALRAGLTPMCADFFLDRDLAAVCDAHQIGLNRPQQESFADFARFAQSQDVHGWIYTGPFENHPEFVDEISTRHRLWGNAGASLRDVRDPFQVADCLRRAGLPCPEVSATASGLSRDGAWLAKPYASGGGLGIRPLESGDRSDSIEPYYQRRISGRSYSSLFLGDSEKCALVGITRQFHGIAGNPFAYRGNIGPLVVSTDLENQVRRIGQAIVARFRLIGLFGVDFIVSEGQAWTVEINPRYTGAVEIHELAGLPPLLRPHRRVCESESLKCAALIRDPNRAANRNIVGKWILYATAPFEFPDLPVRHAATDDWSRIPEIADVPAAGLLFKRGDPVLTVFANGTSPRECSIALRSRIRHWRRQLKFVS